MSILVILQLLVVLLALWIGSKYGSIALGALSGIGLVILVFGFQLKPGTPPTDVIYIIIAAVTCAGALQAAGGMNWMIQIAERLMRKHPERITLLAPLTTFFLTIVVGTGHVVYTLMPIICDISLRQGIRPERPCSIASIASQIGITCSPIAAAVVAFSAISASYGYSIGTLQVLIVTIPSCLIGIMAAVAFSWKRGKDLDKDPLYQARLQDPHFAAQIADTTTTSLDKTISKESRRSVYIFLSALAIILFVSIANLLWGSILPKWEEIRAVAGAPSSVLLADGTSISVRQLVKAGVVVEGITEKVPVGLSMGLFIQIVMIAAAGTIFLLCKTNPKEVVRGSVWQNGMVAVVAIYGIAWMSDTFFGNNTQIINTMLSGMVSKYPWSMAFAFFVVSVLINSQGAVVASMLPLAYTLGIEPWVLVGILPSVYGYFFIPNYPSDIATVNFDRSGTTVIGKYLLNHSFMAPGMIHVVTSTMAGYGIAFLAHTLGLI